MSFKKGDLILVTKINSVFHPNKPKPEIGKIYKVTYVNKFTRCVEVGGNIAHVDGVKPTPLTRELS